ncbi:MAG: lipopolysaccharide core heptose(II) kinase RfaY [Ketobacteraceae bacterium]|nr:lipopolysaccharide core heptose(II) kinase RfaY [Ketobacteraceae bacterium]
MSTLEAFRTNLAIAKTLIVEGRERYIGVTRTAMAIEQIYRKHRKRARILPRSDAEKLLIEAHQKAARKISELCKGNGAIWVKFGQFLSCRPDILPIEYIIELQTLQNNARPVPFEQLHPLILENWGNEWDQRFDAFNVVPVATASVAQVHKAVLKDGTAVAVKLQLPEVKELFEQDSLVFRSLAGVLSPLIKEIDLKQVIDQLIELTMEELDFRTEAKNLSLFGGHPHVPGIKVPALYGRLSSEKILVTEWVDGIRLTDYIEANPDRASSVLNKLLYSFIQQVTQFGLYHADPHPGNFLVLEDESIAILDYGALATLTREEAGHYGALLMALMSDDLSQLGTLFEKAGFECERREIFSEISAYFVAENRREKSVSDRLAEILEKLRKDRVSIPDSFIAMARVIISIGGFMKRYGVDFNWRPGQTPPQ